MTIEAVAMASTEIAALTGVPAAAAEAALSALVDEGLQGRVRQDQCQHDVTLQVAGQGGVPATGVSQVAVNITAVNPTGNGFDHRLSG
jgi:hypothetical protein